MMRVFRRSFCFLLYALDLFPNSTSQVGGSKKLSCYNDHNFKYFLYKERKGWMDAEDQCKKDNRKMFNSTKKSVIEGCIRYSYGREHSITVWRQRPGNGRRCYYLWYEYGRFKYDRNFNTNCSWAMRFVCFSETDTTAKETTSTSTSTLLATTITSAHLMTATTATTIPSTARITYAEYTTAGSLTPTTTLQSTAFEPLTQTQEARTQKPRSTATGTKGNDGPSSGVVVGIVVGLLFLCIAVTLAIVFIIRRRNQQHKPTKSRQRASNVAHGIHSPDVIPSNGPNENHLANAEIGDPQQANDTYYNRQTVGRENRHDNDKYLRQHDGTTNDDSVGNSARECIELSSYKDGTSRKYKYATSTELLVRNDLLETRLTTYDADDNDTYDHINKRASPTRRNVHKVYSHTEDNMNDEYSHTNFKYEKRQRFENETVYEDNMNDEYSHTNFKYDKGQVLENKNVYSHTARDEDAEYSNTNSKNEIGQNSFGDDDIYSHT